MKRLLLIVLLVAACAKPHVGDTRYCTGTGIGVNSNGGITTTILTIPCGTYGPDDPDVQK